MLIRVIYLYLVFFKLFKVTSSLKVQFSYEDNLEQSRTVCACYLFSSLLTDYLRVAFIWLTENKHSLCLVVLNCPNASVSAKQHTQKQLVLQLVIRTTCEGYDLISNSFHFFSILAGSLTFWLFSKVIQKQINVSLHFAIIYILHGDFILPFFFPSCNWFILFLILFCFDLTVKVFALFRGL